LYAEATGIRKIPFVDQNSIGDVWWLAALAMCTQSCNIAVCDKPWNVFVPFILILVSGKNGKG